MNVALGVYLDVNNYNALVFKSTPDTVYFVARINDKDGFDVHAMSPESFVRQFKRHLPLYPVRRCARKYHESYFKKSDLATRVINHLMRT